MNLSYTPIINYSSIPFCAVCSTGQTISHTLPGKGHSVLTLDFFNENGHPTREPLNDILAYFSQQLQ
jgi:hypothetical protein